MIKFNIRQLLILFYLVFYIIFLNANQINPELNTKLKEYDQQKIKVEVQKEFNQLYPLNIKKFYFFKGEERISYKQFLDLSKERSMACIC